MLCAHKAGGRKKGKDGSYMVEYPCGQCMPCRITRRQEWTMRLLLEMLFTPYQYFVTLTYAPEFLPEGGTLVREHLTNYLKRLRKRIGYEKIRYYGCGEYGDESNRPHYHLIIYSQEELKFSFQGFRVTGSDFHEAWSKDGRPIGLVDVHPIPSMDDGIKIARYVASYTVKKMTTEKAMRTKVTEDGLYYSDISDKRSPEFSTMSRRPGIGLTEDCVNLLVDALYRHKVAVTETAASTEEWVHATHDVYMIRIAGKKWPIGRVLREKVLRKFGGEITPDRVKQLRSHLKSKLSYGSPMRAYEEQRRQESEARAKKKVNTGKSSRTL